jgi:hypothetical protein
MRQRTMCSTRIGTKTWIGASTNCQAASSHHRVISAARRGSPHPVTGQLGCHLGHGSGSGPLGLAGHSDTTAGAFRCRVQFFSGNLFTGVGCDDEQCDATTVATEQDDTCRLVSGEALQLDCQADDLDLRRQRRPELPPSRGSAPSTESAHGGVGGPGCRRRRRQRTTAVRLVALKSAEFPRLSEYSIRILKLSIANDGGFVKKLSLLRVFRVISRVSLSVPQPPPAPCHPLCGPRCRGVRNRRLPEQILHRFDVHPGLEPRHRRGVARGVHPDTFHPGVGRGGFDGLRSDGNP